MKVGINKIMKMLGMEVKRNDRNSNPTSFSNLDEEKVLSRLIRKSKKCPKIVVDVGASDGVSMSNSYALFQSGWQGVAIECTSEKFATLSANLRNTHAGLINAPATPKNILSILSAFSVPVRVGVLSLDIDGYDYFVLSEILSKYKPDILCLEINEKIPPPIKFTVKYKADYFWDTSHFYGQSLAKLDELMRQHGYILAELHYNNAFYVNPRRVKVKAQNIENAYRKGYLNRRDRKEKFPWNEDFEYIYALPAKQQLADIRKRFTKYKGKYEISL